MIPTKSQLLDDGIALMERFCQANGLTAPTVAVHPRAQWRFPVCAYYRPTQIEICLDMCAAVGTSGQSWSCPGYTVDRTPYGVIQHELGHHVDVLNSVRKNRYRGDFSINLRKETGEDPVSSYCPDDGEWFAEIFRVFVTNPDLLRIIRPATYEQLRARWTPAVIETWEQVMARAPERTRDACAKKVAESLRRAGRTSAKVPTSAAAQAATPQATLF
ncbi:hypothetical protein ABIC83_002805 [Roseateles asaccharophilus]|uniref:hypothetical protein n=1 Tax=Roseateles asaccharophilus TaxID=582607 RepID=UPI003835EDC5